MKLFKSLFSLIIAILCLVSCVNQKESLNKKPLELNKSTSDSEQSNTCKWYIYEDNSIPFFAFNRRKINSEKELSNGVFSAHNTMYYETIQGREYINFRKVENDKENTYRFLLLNGKLLIEYAELNFSAKEYQVDHWKNYLLEHRSGRYIDIGMKKKRFLKLFTKDVSNYCDSIHLYDDTSESWFVFNKDKRLEKIITQMYTP